MKQSRGPFLKGEFPIVCVVLCAILLRLAFYPESRTPIAVYGTIAATVLFAIVSFFAWRARKQK